MGVLGENSFTRYVNAVQQRSQALHRHVQELPWKQPQLVLDCLAELQNALEELHVAEEELRQQNEELLAARQSIDAERRRYQELFEFAPDGYLITDLYGVVREANRIAGSLVNVAPDRLIGKPLVSFVPPDHRRSFRMLLNQLHTLDRVQEWEVQLCERGDGVIDAAVTVGTVYDANGKPTALRWLLRDVTARKQAEEQLRRVQLQNLELKEVDRLKTQFIATLSHELRTPLNAILGFSNLLLSYFQKQPNNPLMGMVERIVRNGKHLLSLIEDMLDFSKLQSNHLELQVEPFDLSEFVSTTANELRSLANQKGLEFNVLCPAHEVLIENDSTRVRQVLVNLLSNAIKFTEVGCVSVEVLELPEARVAIVITDTGIGMDPEDQSRIFEPFWQANQTTTRQHGGTGLGLAISKLLVELMQGSFSVESQLGQGAIVRVEFPRRLVLASR